MRLVKSPSDGCCRVPVLRVALHLVDEERTAAMRPRPRWRAEKAANARRPAAERIACRVSRPVGAIVGGRGRRLQAFRGHTPDYHAGRPQFIENGASFDGPAWRYGGGAGFGVIFEAYGRASSGGYFGMFVGLTARWLVPGASGGGIVMDVVVGIVGSVIAAAYSLFGHTACRGSTSEFACALVGAVILRGSRARSRAPEASPLGSFAFAAARDKSQNACAGRPRPGGYK